MRRLRVPSYHGLGNFLIFNDFEAESISIKSLKLTVVIGDELPCGVKLSYSKVYVTVQVISPTVNPKNELSNASVFAYYLSTIEDNELSMPAEEQSRLIVTIKLVVSVFTIAPSLLAYPVY